jgi:hypothetical protein
MDDQRYIALPKLYGGPAYARPPVVTTDPLPRPMTADDLPIVAEMTEEDLEFLVEHPAVNGRVPGTSSGGSVGSEPSSAASLRPRPFSIRALADRIRGQRS